MIKLFKIRQGFRVKITAQQDFILVEDLAAVYVGQIKLLSYSVLRQQREKGSPYLLASSPLFFPPSPLVGIDEQYLLYTWGTRTSRR